MIAAQGIPTQRAETLAARFMGSPVREGECARQTFDTGEPDRDETPLEWLERISKLGR